MLKLTGSCMSGLDAVEFLEMLTDSVPDEIKDDQFCEEYERMLNRVRFEVRKAVPVAPTVYKRHFTEYNCGQCCFGVRRDIYKFCPNCGREIKW